MNRIVELQAEAHADDLPIYEHMMTWSDAEVRRYFASGGVEAPSAGEEASGEDAKRRCKALKDAGNALLKAGELAKAIQSYEEAAQLATSHGLDSRSYVAPVLSNLSLALLRSELSEQALSAVCADARPLLIVALPVLSLSTAPPSL